MIRLKSVRVRPKQSLSSIIVVFVVFALFPGADFDTVNDKKADDLPEGVVKVQGRTPLVAASREETQPQPKKKPSPLSQTEQVELKPSTLDFEEQPIGVPNTKSVEVTNRNDKTVQVTSVSGNSLSFHPSLPSNKVINPGEKATFDVIFLPREIGPVSGTLNIYTSLGTLYQEVHGSGTPNPYRLHPLTGSKIPVNGTYAPIITMYNPYPTPLQVTEMYSSGGGIHLELVNGQSEGTQALWVIRPYETKPIMRLSFVGRVVQTHNGYIRVKTNSTDGMILIIPVFIEVTKLPGVYIQRDHNIDFGIVKFGDAQKRMPLTLLNTYKWDMDIMDIFTEPTDTVVTFLRVSSTLQAQGQRGTKVATVIFNPDRLNYEGFHTGKVIVTAQDIDAVKTVRVEATYRVVAMLGSLFSSNATVAFRVGKPPFKTVAKNITFNNRFSSPIVLYDVSLPMRKDVTDHFTVRIASKPYIIQPNSGNHSLVTVRFTPSSSDCMVSSNVRIYSNSSSFSVPLYCYDGSLEYKIVSENEMLDSLEFGVVGEADTVKRAFRVLNRNPIKISIVERSLKGLPHLDVVFIGYRPISTCNRNLKVDRSGHPCNESDYSDVKNSTVGQSKVTMDKDYEAVFEVTISKPKKEGKFNGEIVMTTSLAKELHIPVHLKVILGNLELQPTKLVFESFPYSHQSTTLSAFSHFNYPVRISSVTTPPGDHRFTYKFTTKHKHPILEPGTLTQLGTVHFDPLPHPPRSMFRYLGIHREVLTLEDWTNLLAQIVGNYNVSMSDTRSYKLLRDRWKKLIDSGENRFNSEVVVSTNGSTVHRVPLEVEYRWPKVASVSHLKFSPTLTTESTSLELTLHNPSESPLMVQVVTLNYYPTVAQLLPLMADRFSTSLIKQLKQNTVLSVFSLPEAPVESEISETSTLGSGFTVTQIIPPNSTLPVTVKFSPTSPEPYLSMLLVRNNLTVVDPLLLEGVGITPQLIVDGRESGTTSPILFEYTEKMLSKCENPKNPSVDSVHLVQLLTFNNTSPAVIVVRSLSIDGLSCGAYGYHINHCDQEIKIQPNSSQKVEIMHIPDFTLSRITADLHVHISDTTVLIYPLLTTLPHHMLSACYTVMPRPTWERWISRGLFVFMVLVLVVVTLLAVRNANMITNEHGSTSAERSVDTVTSRSGPWRHGPLHDEPVLDIRTAKSAEEYNNSNSKEPPHDPDRESDLPPSTPNVLAKTSTSTTSLPAHPVVVGSGDPVPDGVSRESTTADSGFEGTTFRKTSSETTIDSRPSQSVSSGGVPLHGTTVIPSNQLKGLNISVSPETGQSTSSDTHGTRDTLSLLESVKMSLSPLSGGDKDKLQQSKKVKQTSGRKQQTKPQTKVQVQTSAVRSTTHKVDNILSPRQRTDSTGSMDSDTSVKKKGELEDRQKPESSATEKSSTAKESSKNVSTEEVKQSEVSPAAPPASTKKEQQLSRKERKKKSKSASTPSDSLAKRSLSPSKNTVLEEKVRLEDVPRPARSSLESLTGSSVSNDVEEDSEQTTQQSDQKRTEPDGVPNLVQPPQKSDIKSKRADILDDISPDSPVPVRKGGVVRGPVRVRTTDTQRQETARSEAVVKKVDKPTFGTKKSAGRKLTKSATDPSVKPSPTSAGADTRPLQGEIDESTQPVLIQEPTSSQRDDVGMESDDSLSVVSGKQASCTTQAVVQASLSPSKERLRVEDGRLDKESHEERKLTSPHELAARLLRKGDVKKVDAPVEEIKDSPSKSTADDDQKISDDQEKRSVVSSPTKPGGRPSHPYSAHLITSKAIKSQVPTTKVPVPQQLMVNSSTENDSPSVTDGTVSTPNVNLFQQSGLEPGPPLTTGIAISTPTSLSSNSSQLRHVKANKSLGDFLPPNMVGGGRMVHNEPYHELPLKHMAGMPMKPVRKTSHPPQIPLSQDMGGQYGMYPADITKYGGIPHAHTPDHMVGDAFANPTSTMAHVQPPDPYMMSHTHGTIPPHMSYSAGIRKRPGHLDITQQVAQGGNIPWMDKVAYPRTMHNYSLSTEQMRFYQQQQQQQQQQQHQQQQAQYMYGQGTWQPSRFTNQSECKSAQTTTINSPLGLLNHLTRPPYQPKPVLPQHTVSRTDLGGEYLPLSSRLTTPTSSSPHLNLAPGTASVMGDHDNHPPSVGHPHSDKTSFSPLWESQSSREDNSKPYGLFGSSSIWGPVADGGSSSAPWMSALSSPTMPSSLEGEKKGKFPDNSPFE